MRDVFQAFIDSTISQVSPDHRWCGLAVAGSWITKEIDNYSDLDLVLVCEDGDFPQVLEDRFAIARSLGDHLCSFTGEHVGEPRLA